MLLHQPAPPGRNPSGVLRNVRLDLIGGYLWPPRAGLDGVTIEALPVTADMRDGWLVEHIDLPGTPFRVVIRVDAARFNRLWVDLVTPT